MPEMKQIYKCELCGNIVEILTPGAGALACCGENMVLLSENTTDAAVEKHVPVAEKKDCGWVVQVGSTLHPMTEDHFIEWIEMLAEDKVYRVHLKPGSTPKACFPAVEGDVQFRAYCNLHGLWKA
ncbi:desulfoferrodoxin [Desulfotalea psychrophila]|uniref:Desulfoferrodoxin n=1 Tax=Desulfotalea psychrophila (strain LSv54 / DSM 12343) TaxID=177439 RepID=Q6AMM8_DESPS|nr:desulfoferrodoxin [Desulfotalea psychrophila]CAG36397.1 probable desulfoferrodoxin [Desulfotalea psychrophila LSv54]